MEKEPNLAALPAELQIGIAQLLEEDQDIRALRATSRALAANCTDLFAERFFQRRSHLYTMHGLEALRDISRKSVFARHVKHVELVVVAVDDQDEAFQEDVETRTGIHLAATEEAERWYRVDQTRRQRCDYSLLHLALDNFKRLGVAKDIKITANLWMRSPRAHPFNARRTDVEKELREMHGGVYGVKALLQKIKPWAEVSDICAGTIDEAVESLLLAIARSHHTVDTLDLGFRSRDALGQSFLPFYHLKFREEIHQIWQVFGQLQKLRLGFEESLHGWGQVEMLRSATSLEELSISMGGNYLGQERSVNFTQEIGAQNIKRLALTDARVTDAELRALLSRYKHSLEVLHLTNIALPHDDDWLELFQWMHHNLTQLSTFSACKLWIDQNDIPQHIYMATPDHHTTFTGNRWTLLYLGRLAGVYLGLQEHQDENDFEDNRELFFGGW